MRVATVFTGVASAAAFAAPANAQAAAKFTPTLGATPLTTRSGICHNAAHWFTLYGYKSANDYTPAYWCYGGIDPPAQDFTVTPPFRAEAFCGGNNVGFWSGYSANGKALKNQRFHQSSNYYYFNPHKFPDSYAYISKIHLSAFEGSQSCNYPP